MEEARGRGNVGDAVRSSRRKLNERRLPEYIALVESFGYKVTKSEPTKAEAEPTQEIEVAVTVDPDVPVAKKATARKAVKKS